MVHDKSLFVYDGVPVFRFYPSSLTQEHEPELIDVLPKAPKKHQLNGRMDYYEPFSLSNHIVVVFNNEQS